MFLTDSKKFFPIEKLQVKQHGLEFFRVLSESTENIPYLTQNLILPSPLAPNSSVDSLIFLTNKINKRFNLHAQHEKIGSLRITYS